MALSYHITAVWSKGMLTNGLGWCIIAIVCSLGGRLRKDGRVVLELVQAELDDIIGLLGHLGGTRDGLPEGLNDVPAEIVNAIRREIETVQDLHHRGG